MSARRQLLGLPLTQNHRHLHRQWRDERRTWASEWNEVIFTDESRICLQHHYGQFQVWRHRGGRMVNSCVMHHHTGPTSGIMLWAGIEYHSRTPLICISVNNKSAIKLTGLYDKLGSYLRALETLNVTTSNCAAMLYPIVESYLPAEVLKAWDRCELNKEVPEDLAIGMEKVLENLMTFLRHEVEGEEHRILAENGFGR
ncbi:transposable element Tcb1 transposase [Trichonephila clavipes]|nr:transposable element Tcb1 transposase [Trichonephila clavipes]